MGMKLTDEQRRVVEIDAGSHLVLAPPGSGKTEILSQRILHAMRTGVNPERMLCATFTNRAAYEMRSRVEAQGAGVALPEVGNLHHFCFRFLRSVGRLSPAKHVLDDCEQLSFAKEVVDVLRAELKTGPAGGAEDREAVRKGNARRDGAAFSQRRGKGAGGANQRASRGASPRASRGILRELRGEGPLSLSRHALRDADSASATDGDSTALPPGDAS